MFANGPPWTQPPPVPGRMLMVMLIRGTTYEMFPCGMASSLLEREYGKPSKRAELAGSSAYLDQSQYLEDIRSDGIKQLTYDWYP